MTPEDRDKDPLFPRIAQDEAEKAQQPTLSEISAQRAKNDKPAFPGHVSRASNSQTSHGRPGMTIRDHYKIEIAKEYVGREDVCIRTPNDAKAVAKQVTFVVDALLEA